MSWLTITPDMMQSRISAAEIAAVQSVSVKDGIDPLQDTINGVAQEIRGYLAAGGYTRGTGYTIPGELYETAVSIIRYRLPLRLPIGKTLLTQDRIDDKNAAVKLLETLVATGKFGIETPDEAAATPAGSSAPSGSFGDRTLTYDRASQDGA